MFKDILFFNWHSAPVFAFVLGMSLVAGCSKQPESATAETDRTDRRSESARLHEHAPDAGKASQNTDSPSSLSSQTTARVETDETGMPVKLDEQNADPTGQRTSSGAAAGKLGNQQNASSKQTPGARRRGEKKTQTSDPIVAKTRGNELLVQAAKAAKHDNMSQAFQTAVQAWEVTRNFPDDPGCQVIAGKALELTKEYGEAVNRSAGTSNDRKPITVK